MEIARVFLSCVVGHRLPQPIADIYIYMFPFNTQNESKLYFRESLIHGLTPYLNPLLGTVYICVCVCVNSPSRSCGRRVAKGKPLARQKHSEPSVLLVSTSSLPRCTNTKPQEKSRPHASQIHNSPKRNACIACGRQMDSITKT